MKSFDYIDRVIDISRMLSEESKFLFGPRQSGKTSYIMHQMDNLIDLHIDLLESSERIRLERNPSLLFDEVRALDKSSGIIVIDEIQLLPSLLNEVHRIMEATDFRFLLTGSSIRKLMHSGVDLLGGRAGSLMFHTLAWPEIKDKGYSLEHIFKTGLLPRMYLSDNPDKLLSSYCGNYISMQVQAEGLIRNMPAFSSFLSFAAMSSGEQVNFSNIASDTGMSANSIKAWYGILTQMLLGNEIPAFSSTKRRKATSISKYYLFDVGVIRSLLGIAPPSENTSEYGKFLEHYICHEIIAYLDYNGTDYTNRGLCYWRTQTGLEVDFVYKTQLAIEVKATKSVNDRKDLKGIRALKEEDIFSKYIVISREERKRKTEDGIYIYPYNVFLDELWSGDLLSI